MHPTREVLTSPRVDVDTVCVQGPKASAALTHIERHMYSLLIRFPFAQSNTDGKKIISWRRDIRFINFFFLNALQIFLFPEIDARTSDLQIDCSMCVRNTRTAKNTVPRAQIVACKRSFTMKVVRQ